MVWVKNNDFIQVREPSLLGLKEEAFGCFSLKCKHTVVFSSLHKTANAIHFLGTIPAYSIQTGFIQIHKKAFFVLWPPLSWCRNVSVLPPLHIHHLYVNKLISHFTNVCETKLSSTYIWRARLNTTRFSSTVHFYTVYICVYTLHILSMYACVCAVLCGWLFVWLKVWQRPITRTDVHSARVRTASLCHV